LCANHVGGSLCFLYSNAGKLVCGEDCTSALARRHRGDVNDSAPVGEKDQSACAKYLCVVGMSKERQHSQCLGHVGLHFNYFLFLRLRGQLETN
jgi:hypothetical protein